MRDVHKVEINFPETHGPEFFVKIDGKKMRHTCGVVITSPISSEDGHTKVQLTFYATVKGKAKGKVVELVYVDKD